MGTLKKILIIGSSDRLDFPDFGLENISCKIDTGADTSSIHCNKARIREIDGKEVLVFRLLDPKNKSYLKKDFTTTQFKEKRVKNSFGDKEYRYFIMMKVEIFGQIFETEFSLSNRSELVFPVLIGKQLLKQIFLVDVAQKNLSFTIKKNKK